MSKVVVGIDVSKEKIDVALGVGSEKPKHRVFKNSLPGFAQLLAWLQEQGVSQAHVCLEATGRYEMGVAHFLHTAGHLVSLVNPLRIKKYRESTLSRHKTDKDDAALIAEFCRTQSPRLWSPPNSDWLELQVMVRHLSALQTALRQTLNRLSAQLPSETVAALLREHIALLKAQLASLKRAIHTFIVQHPLLKQQHDLLISIGGIGSLTAARLLAEIPDIHGFDSARQLAAYGGTTPAHFQSGSSVRKPSHLAKTANGRLRDALYFPAIVAMRHNPIIRAFCQRLLAQGKPPKLVVVAAMRKLLHLVFGVLKHHQPFDPHYLSFAA
jgi:transposase